jgi:hypothetical protein
MRLSIASVTLEASRRDLFIGTSGGAGLWLEHRPAAYPRFWKAAWNGRDLELWAGRGYLVLSTARTVIA